MRGKVGMAGLRGGMGNNLASWQVSELASQLVSELATSRWGGNGREPGNKRREAGRRFPGTSLTPIL